MLTNVATILAWGAPGPFEMIIIAGLGLLLFGKRLPEVGRSLGKGIVEFKRGLKDVESEVTQVDNHDANKAFPVVQTPAQAQLPTAQAAYTPAQNTVAHVQPEQVVAKPAAGFRFDPYTGKPIGEDAPVEQAAQG